MRWTPASGTKALVARTGLNGAVAVLVDLLLDRIDKSDLTAPPLREVLIDIGNGHARRLMFDETGQRLTYWPRVWSARSLGYAGSMTAGPALSSALGDEHWRVRMMSLQSIGRIGAGESSSEIVACLEDPHPRVRNAAVSALRRVGDESAIPSLLANRSKLDGSVESAIEAMLRRSDESRGTGDPPR